MVCITPFLSCLRLEVVVKVQLRWYKGSLCEWKPCPALSLSFALCPAAETAVSLCWCVHGVENKNGLTSSPLSMPSFRLSRVAESTQNRHLEAAAFVYLCQEMQEIVLLLLHLRECIKRELPYLTRATVALPETVECLYWKCLHF